ncbi:uncharacterized protein LOC129613657 isoform X2 [Condylostylus longicornis]|uniref:uncharacterized protein LOC129613657 isoform X2 n=1 Tax=Condylostylus longicornis TaxID=2530218 RepID=UPI00244E34B1|nr:uncharacterized protein LOC129613657 isoform X2 [Condylostylus longicornis]XP_055383815.1 uncharacterized protein LOC129613657 isoform X2 [Condylostylus longicornis]
MSPNSVTSTTAANARSPTKIAASQILNKTQSSTTMQEKKINRSNSLVNTALKWIPLLNQHYNNHNGSGNNVIDGNGSALKQFGSTVAVQKLRESKWFNSDEQRIFCAVIECGFIVEIRGEQNSTSSSSTISDDENDKNDDTLDKINNEIKLQKIIPPSTSKLIENYDNDQIFSNSSSTATSSTTNSWFGVVLCKTLKDNKPKPDTIEIFSVKIRQNGVRVYKTTLETIWNNNWQIRINNFADREKTPHNEKDIRNQNFSK